MTRTTNQEQSRGSSAAAQRERIRAALTGYEIADPEQRIAAYHEYADKVPANLGIANNVLLFDLMKNHVFDNVDLTEDDCKYLNPPYGPEDLLKRVAAFMNQTFRPKPAILPTDVFATAGGSGALESLAFGLLHGKLISPGDTVMLPAPYWPGFNWCFEQRPQLPCLPVPLGGDGFELSVEALEDAYQAAPDPKPKLLVLTNPHNPLGINYGKELLRDVCVWALGKPGMHVISDEIYTHSQIEGRSPGHTSVLALDLYKDNTDRIHLVYGPTKDFGLSGFRVGFLVSKSPAVQEVMKGNDEWKSNSWFGPLDSLKYAYVTKVFDTEQTPGSWPHDLMRSYGQRLTDTHTKVADALKAEGIAYVGEAEQHRNPAQFFLLDLRAYLRDAYPTCKPESFELFPTVETRESKLETYIRECAEVLLLPGLEMHCPEPGYFRMCYTAEDPDKVLAAVKSMGSALRQLPPA